MKYTCLIGLALTLLLFSCAQKEAKQGADQPVPGFRSGLTEDTACLLSQVAYCPDIPGALGRYMPGWQLLWEAAELNGNHAFVAGNGREYALAIRGSLLNFSWAAFQNWIYQDLHVAAQEKWPYTADSTTASVSEGAYTGWENLCNMQDKKTGQHLLPLLDSLVAAGVPLLITGHSLGGNLATIYGSYLWKALKEKGRNNFRVNVISFAAPAAGNAAFAEDFNKKFPASIRVENRYDIVPKFPTAPGIRSLGELYSDSLPAGEIEVGYKNLRIPLPKLFTLLNTGLTVLEFTSGLSPYEQTNGNGTQINLPLSGKNSGREVLNWLDEAGYQHSIERYAGYEKVAVISCN
ncbi:MAG: hypothetical protein HZA79_05925 [Sphingobacteriales bacterium]|nr:hypothetical protein [Sphingobacteriales bacterium]